MEMILFNPIAALKEGDEVVFSDLFKEYHEKVYFYILAKTHSGYLAEETTQLTFIKLWNYRNNLDESLSLSIQIFRIAKTTCIDLLRKEACRSKLSIAAKNFQVVFNNVSESIEEKELQKKLTDIVKQMPPMRKKVFELSRFDSRSHKEISQILSISVKTVENHITLAIKQLRHFLTILLLCIIISLFL